MKPQQQLDLIDQFFSFSEIIDLALLEDQFQLENKSFKREKISIDQLLDSLETTNFKNQERAIGKLYLACIETYSDTIKINFPNVNKIYRKDGLPHLVNYLPKLIEPLIDAIENPDIEPLYIEQKLRVILNILYLVIISNLDSPTLIDELSNSFLESALLEIVRFSLDAFFIPTKKALMLFYLYLYVIFQDPIENVNQNKYLTKEIVEEMYKGEPRILITSLNQIESFYQRFILKIQEGSKPQMLIRSIIKILLSATPQSAKSKVVAEPFREWEAPYLLLDLFLEKQKPSHFLATKTRELMSLYTNAQQTPPSVSASDKEDGEATAPMVVTENERHRIILGNVIASIFSLITHKFGENDIFQYFYFTQLLADEKGVIIFIKFLTDNFNYLSSTRVACIDELNRERMDYYDLTEDSVFKTINLTYKICRGSQEKIETHLFEKNCYFTIKKMPGYFKKTPRLSFISTKLLKIQTKLFTKKMRQLASNMKVVTDIFCKETDLNKLKKQREREEKMKQMMQDFKLDDLKRIIKDFNNNNYLTPKLNIEEEKATEEENLKSYGSIYTKLIDSSNLPEGFDNNYEAWLENNVWNE